MTSRLNTTRGSQLVAKQWRRCALGDLGPGGHTTILARGHTSHFPWGSRSTNKPFGAVRDSCGPVTSFIVYIYRNIYIYMYIYIYSHAIAGTFSSRSSTSVV